MELCNVSPRALKDDSEPGLYHLMRATVVSSLWLSACDLRLHTHCTRGILQYGLPFNSSGWRERGTLVTRCIYTNLHSISNGDLFTSYLQGKANDSKYRALAFVFQNLVPTRENAHDKTLLAAVAGWMVLSND